MITYRASLDVPVATLVVLTRWIQTVRARPGCRPWRRAVGPRAQALLVLRWYRDRTQLHRLAADAGVSVATWGHLPLAGGYRYLDEGISILEEHAPTAQEAIEAAQAQGAVYVNLDGTLIETDRVAARKPDGRHLGAPPARGGVYSGKHKTFGVNVQVITDPSGFPIWTSPALPGSTHDLAAARQLVLAHLDPYTSKHLTDPLVVLADKGYAGAGVGVLTPTKRRSGEHPEANPTRQGRDQLLTGARAIGERGNALLKGRWHALRRVTLSPTRVGAIAAGALTLTLLERPHR